MKKFFAQLSIQPSKHFKHVRTAQSDFARLILWTCFVNSVSEYQVFDLKYLNILLTALAASFSNSPLNQSNSQSAVNNIQTRPSD